MWPEGGANRGQRQWMALVETMRGIAGTDGDSLQHFFGRDRRRSSPGGHVVLSDPAFSWPAKKVTDDLILGDAMASTSLRWGGVLRLR